MAISNYDYLVALTESTTLPIYGTLRSSNSTNTLTVGIIDSNNEKKYVPISLRPDVATDIMSFFPSDTVENRKSLLKNEFVSMVQRNLVIITAGSGTGENPDNPPVIPVTPVAPTRFTVGAGGYSTIQTAINKAFQSTATDVKTIVIPAGIYRENISLYPGMVLISPEKATISGTVTLYGKEGKPDFYISGVTVSGIAFANDGIEKDLHVDNVSVIGDAPCLISGMIAEDDLYADRVRVTNLGTGLCVKITDGNISGNDLYMSTQGDTVFEAAGESNIDLYHVDNKGNWVLNGVTTGLVTNLIFKKPETGVAIIKNSTGSLYVDNAVQPSAGLKVNIGGTHSNTVIGSDFEIIPDIHVPVVSVTNNGGSFIIPGQEVEFTVASDCVDATYALTVNNISVTLTGLKGTYTFPMVGSYTIVATATSEGVTGTKTVTVLVIAEDSVPPTVSISTNAPSLIIPGTSVEFTVTTSDDVAVTETTFTVNGTPVTLNSSGKCTYVLADVGIYSVVATATDAQGNVGTETITLTVIAADTELPIVDITHNAPSLLVENTAVEFTVVASDNVAVTGTTLTINDVAMVLDNDGKTVYSFTTIGSYVIVATATDAQGNVGTKTITLTVVSENEEDTELPVVTILHDAPTLLIENTPVEFTVTASDNVEVTAVTLSINDIDITLDATHKATYTFDNAGVYNVVATASDAEGNIGTANITLTVVAVDSELPVVSVVSDAPSLLIAGTTVNFTVTASDNVEVISKSLAINSVDVVLDSMGLASYTFADDGIYTVVATATDAQGNSGQSTITLTVVEVDSENPVVSINHDAPALLLEGTIVNFTVTVSDNVEVTGKTLTVNDADVTLDAMNMASYTFGTEGSYIITATATDAQGNVGTETLTLTVVAVDSEDPVVDILHDAPALLVAGTTVNFTVTASDNVEVTSKEFTINGVDVALDATGLASYEFTTEGSYIVSATATDAQNNTGNKTLTLTVVAVDSEEPVVSISHDAPSLLVAGTTVNLTVTATDNVEVVSKTLTVNSVDITLDAAGLASYNFDIEGAYVVTATATDAQGNVGTETINLVAVAVDNVDPVVSIAHDAPTLIVEGAIVNFTVTASDDVDVVSKEFTINGTTIELDENQMAAYTFDAAGQYEIVATAKDAQNNEGSMTISFTVVAVDSENPVVTLVHDGVDPIAAGTLVNFTVTASDNVDVVDIGLTVDGNVVTLDTNGMGSYTFDTAGSFEVIATAKDAQNNEGTNTVTVVIV